MGQRLGPRAMPSLRQSSAMLSSPRRPSSTMRILSSAENWHLVALRMSLTVFSALSGAGTSRCLSVLPPRGDEPEPVSCAISSYCPVGADGDNQVLRLNQRRLADLRLKLIGDQVMARATAKLETLRVR